jgi:hypothetical protein
MSEKQDAIVLSSTARPSFSLCPPANFCMWLRRSKPPEVALWITADVCRGDRLLPANDEFLRSQGMILVSGDSIMRYEVGSELSLQIRTKMKGPRTSDIVVLSQAQGCREV